MKPTLAIVETETDAERTEKRFKAAVERSDGSLKEAAIEAKNLGAVGYTNSEISALVGKDESFARRLRKWAEGGFAGDPWRSKPRKKSAPAPKVSLKSNNNSEPDAAASDPYEDECDDCANDQERWQRSLGNMAGEAVSLDAYWTRQFGEWKKFDVPSELVTLARQAAEAWEKLASGFEKARRNSQ
jgi:hypothetical protein